jgi:hypothetical protein
MQHTMSSQSAIRSPISPIKIAVALWIAALVYLGFGLVTVSLQSKSAAGDLEIPFSFLGIPLLTGFRHAGRIGTHLGWGTAFLMVAPFVVGMALALWRIRRAATR